MALKGRSKVGVGKREKSKDRKKAGKEEAIEERAKIKSIGRKPLYEPRYRVQLPPRKKITVQRWPKIDYPPLKTKPWDPSNIPSPSRPPKPVIEYPPIKTKPWNPPEPPKAPPKPKIEYPPLKLRKARQPREPKPRSKLPRLEKTFFPIKPSTLGRVWNNFRHIGSKLMILRGNYSQSSKKYSFISRDKQSSAACVICLAYAHLYPPSRWFCRDLDKILDAGDFLYKNTLVKIGARTPLVLKPCRIESIFYVDFNKFSVAVGSKLTEGYYGPQERELIQQLQENANEMINSSPSGGVIINYDDENMALWKDQEAYYVYLARDVDACGNLMRKNAGAAAVVRTTSAQNFLDYLAAILKPCAYKIYSFEVLKVLPLERFPAEDKQKEKSTSMSEVPKLPEPKVPEPSEDSIQIPDEEEEKDDEPYFNPADLIKVNVHTFSQDYKLLADDRGILRVSEFIQGPQRSAAMAVACLYTLLSSKSRSWTCETLSEILNLGDIIFEDNFGETEVDRPSINDIRCPINDLVTLKSENSIFGQLNSINPSIADLDIALKEFFRQNDAGVIHGPQVIAVWQEANYFFHFDPKERDYFGKKFIQSEDTGDSESGAACTMWFRSIEALVEVYKSNVSKKHRQDLFRIVKANFVPYLPPTGDWNSWRSLGWGRWIIRGRAAQDSEEFRIENRNNQGMCMAVAALAFKNLEPMDEWNLETVDDILWTGDDFYTVCVLNLKKKGTFSEPRLEIDELERSIKIGDEIADINVSGFMISGSLTSRNPEEFPDLETALEKFFEYHDSGILVSCEIALAIWKAEDNYYIFDSHPRDENGKNPRSNPMKKSNLGLCCALRFSNLAELANLLTSNFEIKDSPEFNLWKVEVKPKIAPEDQPKPDFHNYLDFPEYRYAGMLRAADDTHEDTPPHEIVSKDKTFTNLVTSLAMSKLIPSIQWQETDICEILKLGFKLFRQASADQNVQLFVLENCQIGPNSFQISDQTTQAAFNKIETPPPSAEEVLQEQQRLNSFEVVEDLADVEETEEKRVSEAGSEVGSTPGSLAEDEEILFPPSSDLGPRFDLEKMLEDWTSVIEKAAILESDVFDLAIWKQDDLYFLFDPKATKADGTLPNSRLKEIRERIRRRKHQRKQEKLAGRRTTEQLKSVLEVVDHIPWKFQAAKALPSVSTLFDKQIQELKSEENGFCATVLAFTQLKDLISHIHQILPTALHEEHFTWHGLDIKNRLISELPQDSAWNDFQLVQANHWILRGSKFQLDAPNGQDSSCASGLMALAFISASNVTEWTSNMIDTVIKYGARLFKASYDQIRKNSYSDDKSWSSSSCLMSLRHLITPFVIDKAKFDVQIEVFDPQEIVIADEPTPEKAEEVAKSDKKERGKGSRKEKEAPKVVKKVKLVPNLKNLRTFLREFFETHSAGVLTLRDYSVAVFKEEDGYFMFDSHRNGPDGVQKSIGVACLSKFSDLSAMTKVFLANVEQLEDGLNIFELNSITITMSKFSTLQAPEPLDSQQSIEQL